MTPARPPASPPPVVTGMGILCSIGDSVDRFEASLRSGRSAFRKLNAGEPPLALGAMIDGFDFAASLEGFAGLPGDVRERARGCGARSTLVVRAALHCALQAWLQAGFHRAGPVPERIGLIVAGSNLGCRFSQEHYQRYADTPEYLPASYGLRFLDTDLIGALSEVLGIRGPGFTVGGASASGNIALAQGRQAVLCGEADACLVVGALADLSPLEWQAWKSMGAVGGKRLDAERSCRPFDRDHEGFAYGQGCAAILLEHPDSARHRGARILAALAGASACLDGNRSADPDPDGEARAMTAALRMAGIGAGEIDYVNAHGTSSPLGDRTEVAALKRVFRDEAGRAWVNSTKGLTGHCLFAAGVVEAVATVIQMRGGFVHPNPGLDNPIDPGMRFVGAAAEPAPIRRALSNSFGFGGFNSSIVLAAA